MCSYDERAICIAFLFTFQFDPERAVQIYRKKIINKRPTAYLIILRHWTNQNHSNTKINSVEIEFERIVKLQSRQKIKKKKILIMSSGCVNWIAQPAKRHTNTYTLTQVERNSLMHISTSNAFYLVLQRRHFPQLKSSLICIKYKNLYIHIVVLGLTYDI